ncbi:MULTISPECIES: ATP-binding protein [unclassified Lysobacter]|jgi:serine/threonine-protein kinase RsbW|uniref:ATP-binding protein n=1 Tax=unclassified Lysobacter TaxID=2635362 RepID=UPI001F578B5C|nr:MULTISPECIES: ATP-binding protein [unclassified Lysobacter]HEX5664979.1 ATP-binding protein [Xanthomonadaceae bacterium]
MRLKISVPNRREHLGELLDAIDRALAEHAIAANARGDLRLIVEEVASNAMDHGLDAGERGPQQQILVDIARSGARLLVEFRDTGRPFDPLSAPKPDLDAGTLDRRIGGLGVHLVRSLAESVSYTREEPYNILRVVLPAH